MIDDVDPIVELGIVHRLATLATAPRDQGADQVCAELVGRERHGAHAVVAGEAVVGWAVARRVRVVGTAGDEVDPDAGVRSGAGVEVAVLVVDTSGQGDVGALGVRAMLG